MSVEYFTKVQANPGWRVILESFARFVNPVPTDLILDVGCGPGALVHIFREQHKAFGVDADIAMLAGGRFFTGGRLPFLPFSNNTFDIITATNVIYLVDDPSVALHEITRILKPNGMFNMLNPSPKMSIATATVLADERGLTDFARENFIHWGEVAEQKVRWSEADISALFRQAGLTLIDCQAKIGDGLALYAKGKKDDDD